MCALLSDRISCKRPSTTKIYIFVCNSIGLTFLMDCQLASQFTVSCNGKKGKCCGLVLNIRTLFWFELFIYK